MVELLRRRQCNYLKIAVWNIGYCYKYNHCPARLNHNMHGLSRLGINTTMGRKITGIYSDNSALDTYCRLTSQLLRNNPCPSGEVIPHGVSGYCCNTEYSTTPPISNFTTASIVPAHMAFTSVTFDTSSPINTACTYVETALKNRSWELSH